MPGFSTFFVVVVLGIVIIKNNSFPYEQPINISTHYLFFTFWSSLLGLCEEYPILLWLLT